MALIKCPECGKEISDQATACPFCGCPIKKSAADINAEKELEEKEDEESQYMYLRHGERISGEPIIGRIAAVSVGCLFLVLLIVVAIVDMCSSGE